MRSIWAGAISFGLVVIPVKLYAATEQRDITFRQVHRKDGARIQFRRVCPLDGEEAPYSDGAKGYELPTGDMVVLTDEDLADLPLVTAHRIEVLHFAPGAQVEPIYAAKSYYTEPEPAGARAYVLFRDALQNSGKVAVAKVALRQREALAALRVREGVITLETLLGTLRGALARIRGPVRGDRGPGAGAEDGRLADRHDDRGLRPRPVPRRLPRGARGGRPGQDRGQRHRPPGRPGGTRPQGRPGAPPPQGPARRPDRDPASQRRGPQIPPRRCRRASRSDGSVMSA